ncbi:DUF7716 domain-containing protein [Serratia microhaemolytica]|uniref:DUF7716 domain-containing protein n=1 Tax=Serratia microhaemolytica TaxID=2675110 RepID=UPI000FDF2BCC|nr:hypothetical protein [Serratia microhaemolytica]
MLEDSRDDNFCLYGDDCDELKVDGNYYVADYPDVDDQDNEVFPQVVISKKLNYLYSGQQFVDVIDSVLEQKPSASLDEFVRALNYYSVNDDFLDF